MLKDQPKRWCPVCEHHFEEFAPFGARTDALCPNCLSLERHRLLWIYFQWLTKLFDGSPRKMLHVAPEICFEKRLRERVGAGYLTADLDAKKADVQMDIMSIQFPDNQFDVIYCSHVLEHVPDDRQAMREFHRVLKPDGWAILQVPVYAEQTFENPALVTPEEREREFGQFDHVRRYGPDYVDRLRETGFQVKVILATDLFEASILTLLGIRTKEDIYYCTR